MQDTDVMDPGYAVEWEALELYERYWRGRLEDADDVSVVAAAALELFEMEVFL